MISAVRAFEVAHEAIAGKRCHDAPCDIAIERDKNIYTVTFSSPAGSAPAEPTRVFVHAVSGSVREIRNAGEPERNPRLAGMISSKRALEIGLSTLRETGVAYDERWTTTVTVGGDRYEVTFPLPEDTRAAPLRPDFALQVWVDRRSGKVVEIVHAS